MGHLVTAVPRYLASKRHDRADLLGGESCRPPVPRFIGKPDGDIPERLAGHPSPPPKKYRFPPNTKPPRRLPDANIVGGKQDDAGTLNKPLWRSARAHQALKNQPILFRYLYRFRQ